jgi:hypothetical protein
MRHRLSCLLLAAVLGASASAHAQREWREYLPFEGYNGMAPIPLDADVPGEFVVGRLMYPGGGGDWLRGGTSWTVDYPKGDRTLAALLRRFTRINVRSVEQPVNLSDGDDAFHWPFLMVGLAGNWALSEGQVETLREYLLRGGFLYADSFFGSYDWVGFTQGLDRVFPDRPIIDLPADHPVFHIVYDISEILYTRIPHAGTLPRGYLSDGDTPHWRGIEDDEGRLMVLIGFNNDTPDAWQWADNPRYPAEAANLGLRIGVNIAAYTMTH